MKSANSFTPFILFSILLLLALIVPHSNGAMTCSIVLTDLKPCLTYLKSGSGMPPTPCCDGATKLAAAATSTADKQTACGCLKKAASSQNVKAALAQALPANCKISLPYTISPTTDCSKIT